MQEIQAQPRPEDGFEDVAERVTPLIRHIVDDRRLAIGVGAARLRDDGPAVGEVGIGDAQLLLLLRPRRVVEHVGERVRLHEIEDAAGLQEVGDRPPPARPGPPASTARRKT